MHNIAPEEERWDQLGPALPSCISHSSFRVRRKQQVIKRAATAPKTAPGKKPAAIAPAGKEGHDVDTCGHVVGVADFSDEGDATGVIVARGVAELSVVDDDDAVLIEELDTDGVAVLVEELELELDADVDDVVLAEELDTDAVAVVEVFWFREQVLPWQV